MEKMHASLGELLGTAERIVLGKHLIVELWTHNAQVLDDPVFLRDTLMAAARRGNLNVINIAMHEFAPHGVTGVVLLAESHLSIHTWPEYGYAAIDVFTCGGNPWAVIETLKERLDVQRIEVRELDRGILG
ncbi:MAG: adenosylmethionine decarboxylase [Ardenticatenia bacterium]|nr:adenosylmethionine decarboxylase [Ardenticatenia bacterium]